MGYDRNMSSRLLIGIALIIFGSLFIMDNYGLIDFDIPFYVFTWEAVFIVIGLILLVSSRHKLPGFIFLGIGLFNLFPNFWPVALIVIGLYLILRKNSKPKVDIFFGKYDSKKEGKTSSKMDPDKIEDVSIFGGSTKTFSTQNFKGGDITAIFGGSEINLMESSLAEGNQILEITTIFGGSTLIIPNHWNVELDIVPIFGGFSDKRIKDPNLNRPMDRKLIIKGTLIFGGGEIKNFA
ncbi:MAG: cell wall-active antibiotics response protein [Bacteroidetes bacterium]|nr:cell wall-active antibiotics response protein [Bacteroidota bacterium]